MQEFRVQSSETEAELLFFGVNGDNFSVAFSSGTVNCQREVWAYTDAYGLADLFEWMASQSKPWKTSEGWESIEGEFKLYASCNVRGNITFDLELNHLGCTEEWRVKSQLKSEFGQLPSLAKKARAFFGPSPS